MFTILSGSGSPICFVKKITLLLNSLLLNSIFRNNKTKNSDKFPKCIHSFCLEDFINFRIRNTVLV